MPSTRSSARIAGNSSSSPPKKNDSASSGRKRKADNSPAQAKKEKKSSEPKKQKTIEETMPDLETEDKEDKDDEEVGDEGVEDKEMVDAADEIEEKQDAKDDGNNEKMSDESVTDATDGTTGDAKDEEPTNEAKEEGEGEPAEADAAKDASTEKSTTQDDKSEQPAAKSTKDDASGKAMQDGQPAKNEESAKTDEQTKTEEPIKQDITGAVSESTERKQAMPSNILEKGIIYFFTRARVGIDDPSSVQDIARSYIVLRPLPQGASIGSGTLEDSNNNRLLALPKKVLPKSGRDQFLTFVEKVGKSIKELKEEVMKGSDYETKTTGSRHTNAVTPIGEGVYAITTTGRESHLAYMLTIPEEMGEVQKDMGLAQQGSFVTSLKNPSAPGPANASLPRGPEFPKEIMEEFAGRRWMSMQPKHLDYENAQVLLIGEGQGEEAMRKAMEVEEKDKKGDKETPQEEIEKLEEEDHERVEGLKGDEAEAVFKDLKLSHEEYPKLMTTW